MQDILKAALEYLHRNSYFGSPEGKWKQNKFYPSDNENCSCCYNVRSPSRRWPHSLYKHCFTYLHIANLFGVQTRDVKRTVNDLSKCKDGYSDKRKLCISCEKKYICLFENGFTIKQWLGDK